MLKKVRTFLFGIVYLFADCLFLLGMSVFTCTFVYVYANTHIHICIYTGVPIFCQRAHVRNHVACKHTISRVGSAGTTSRRFTISKVGRANMVIFNN